MSHAAATVASETPGFSSRRLLGALVGWLARAWLASLRVRVTEDAALDPGDPRPWILCFFHGTQFPLLAWARRRPTAALVSLSRDGELQAGALAVQGLRVVRGSSSRGGARGLVALVRRARAGDDVAMAVDGPKGPYGVVKPGALALARSSGALLVPMGSAVRRGWTAKQAWDRFSVPWPFSEVRVVLGAPLEGATSDAACVEHAIADANARARFEA